MTTTGVMMALSSALLKLVYPPPASLAINALSVISFLSLCNGGWMETKGKHMQYSKLRGIVKVVEKNKEKAKVQSKIGMIVAYAPAFVAGVSSFAVLPAAEGVGDLRLTLLRSAVTLHFFKRVFEVLFVHKYSGWMDVETMISISLSYLMYSATIIYNQYLMLQQSLSQPAVDFKYIGVAMFVVGIVGNFYHHYLLSKLRAKGDDDQKCYKFPRGGLFGLVICPHYLFEIVGFVGIACISQTLYALSFTVGSAVYLMGRSYATRKWYQSKFEEFPKDVKALFPFIF